MKKIFAGMFLALSLLAAGSSANAADINGTQVLTFVGDTSDFGSKFGSGTTNKTFAEKFTFAVSNAFDLSSAIISIALKTQSAVDLTGFTLTSSNGTNITGTKSTVGNTQYFELSGNTLASGSYTLTVLGKITGTAGGSFGGNISISAVPEVTTTAMMLAGLAIVGFGAYRRRRQDAGRVNLGNVAMA
ncbi:FxDxF family PEP-CTERM protein [Herbaspirillum sp. alder98]|uniref:FxDxF family PEP-CTERM protein n=1 Tax=Herbaspirillum sp. alder98 TaxID=2913096 RepID=UPI001CD8982E|nr:FxDxF family PEP-CTERM protein [Herbaspirillum sp. alder98]MCA1325177.1 FxDxF family PEP-CTERM protein [Herbaspirillum sp. alder98]